MKLRRRAPESHRPRHLLLSRRHKERLTRRSVLKIAIVRLCRLRLDFNLETGWSGL